jgi:diacylglycerol O-acyltransferase / wax synthase
MQPEKHMKLSALDSSYLEGETVATPMHVGCLVILKGATLFDSRGRLRAKKLRTHIMKRWEHFAAMQVQLVNGEHAELPYQWEHVTSLDSKQHIKVVRCEGDGSARDVHNTCASILERRLSREAPMWQISLITGMSDHGLAMLIQVHHSLGDGVGGAALLGALTEQWDSDAETSPVDAPTFSARLREAATAIEGSAFLFTTLRDRPSTTLNREVTSRRQLATLSIDLAPVVAAAHRLGVTVNDIVLGAVGGAIGSLLEVRGESIGNQIIEVMVPVSTRTSLDSNDIGNHTAVLQVPIPIGLHDPVATIRAVHRVIAKRKDHHVGQAVAALEALGSYVHLPFSGAVARFVFGHQNLVNLVVSNVRGPATPLTICGAEVTSITPFLPLAGDLPVSIAAFSYHGELHLGALWDPHACPDAPSIIRELKRQFMQIGESHDR